MKLFFIHGAGAKSSVWHLQLHKFQGSEAVELPGHPNGEGRRSIGEYVDFLEEYVMANPVSDPVLVGHSMGGAICMEYALRPHTLAGLILVGTGARLRVDPEILSKLQTNYDEACRMVARWSVSQKAEPFIAEQIAETMRLLNPEVVLGDFLACDGFDRMGQVQSVTCPTLILCGEDDQMTPRKYSEYLHQKIPNSKLVIIPGAGHSVMIEKHREFNQVLMGFLESL